jgi:hypothetical protein
LKSKPKVIEEFGHALDIVGKPFMSRKYWMWFRNFWRYGVRYIEFWVIFVIENSTKLQKIVLKGESSWVISSH